MRRLQEEQTKIREQWVIGVDEKKEKMPSSVFIDIPTRIGDADEGSAVGSEISSLPHSVQSFLESCFDQDPISVEAIKSSQQEVFVIQYPSNSQLKTGGETCVSMSGSMDSALANLRQKPLPDCDSTSYASCPILLSEGAGSSTYSVWHSGNKNIVLRFWKGGSRWWNLNRKSSGKGTLDLANAELAAYQLAHMALGEKIPRVLHVQSTQQINESRHGGEDEFLWACMEYVGPRSTRFVSSSVEPSPWHYESYWMDSMTKSRHEFGFMEPHPRWGRVPVDQCLDYALTVLKQFIIPLHKWCFQLHQIYGEAEFSDRTSEHRTIDCAESLIRSLGTGEEGYGAHTLKQGYSFGSMVQVYRRAYNDMEGMISSQQDEQEKSPSGQDMETLSHSVKILGKCIEQLELEMDQNVDHLVEHSLPFVLVHMDCQPQNLIFARTNTSPVLQTNTLQVSSVLDWEEAAYADPRFELLLLGRKVCANEAQARLIWETYQLTFREHASSVNLGPIEPWLRLETVHSLSTLLLQSMNHQEYGRSPWETKPDLWGKVSREFQRLARAGWTFCASVQ